jgi:hypothetical protein
MQGSGGITTSSGFQKMPLAKFRLGFNMAAKYEYGLFHVFKVKTRSVTVSHLK